MGTNEPDRPKIVAGIDGSPSSFAALEWAARQADLTGSALVVVGAWHLPGTYAAAGITDRRPASSGTARPAAQPALPIDEALHHQIRLG